MSVDRNAQTFVQCLCRATRALRASERSARRALLASATMLVIQAIGACSASGKRVIRLDVDCTSRVDSGRHVSSSPFGSHVSRARVSSDDDTLRVLVAKADTLVLFARTRAGWAQLPLVIPSLTQRPSLEGLLTSVARDGRVTMLDRSMQQLLYARSATRVFSSVSLASDASPRYFFAIASSILEARPDAGDTAGQFVSAALATSDSNGRFVPLSGSVRLPALRTHAMRLGDRHPREPLEASVLAAGSSSRLFMLAGTETPQWTLRRNGITISIALEGTRAVLSAFERDSAVKEYLVRMGARGPAVAPLTARARTLVDARSSRFPLVDDIALVNDSVLLLHRPGVCPGSEAWSIVSVAGQAAGFVRLPAGMHIVGTQGSDVFFVAGSADEVRLVTFQ